MHVLLVVGLYVIAFYLVFNIFRIFFLIITNRGGNVPAFVKKKKLFGLNREDISFLEKYNSYYFKLSHTNKQEFQKRVVYFINHKKFIPRGYTHINGEMQVLIASAAVQLTFGFPKMHFPHFWRILVYEDDYYSRITRKYHQGEVNPGGLIVLSWRNILEGFKNTIDGKNLALHEMTHALHLENTIANAEYSFLHEKDWQVFNQLALAEMAKMKKGQSYLFRAYAKVNFHEFFAITVEHFFERSQYFSIEAPELYAATVSILKQDPLRF